MYFASDKGISFNGISTIERLKDLSVLNNLFIACCSTKKTLCIYKRMNELNCCLNEIIIAIEALCDEWTKRIEVKTENNKRSERKGEKYEMKP